MRLTISTRFANTEPMKNKRNIGAVNTNPVNTNQGGRMGHGRRRARYSSGRGHGGGKQLKVIMNGVDVTDVTRNYTPIRVSQDRIFGLTNSQANIVMLPPFLMNINQ